MDTKPPASLGTNCPIGEMGIPTAEVITTIEGETTITADEETESVATTMTILADEGTEEEIIAIITTTRTEMMSEYKCYLINSFI